MTRAGGGDPHRRRRRGRAADGRRAIEALRCTGLPETLVYDGVPAGPVGAADPVGARPRSSRPVTATVTLSYLASGFDWQANYVATLSPDGAHVDLFAWLTLAIGDETSFADADTQAVAGRLNREQAERRRARRQRPLQLRCWPQGHDQRHSARASWIASAAAEITRSRGDRRQLAGNQPAGPDPHRGSDQQPAADRRMRARQEELGDLKLYRIPEPVTVAAHSLKQVAFLERSRGAGRDRLPARHLRPGDDEAGGRAGSLLLTRNRARRGSASPLPAGRVQLFASAGGRPILVGEGDDPRPRGRRGGRDRRRRGARRDQPSRRRAGRGAGATICLTVTNDQSVPVRLRSRCSRSRPADDRARATPRLGRRNGLPALGGDRPANGSATLRYRVRRRDGGLSRCAASSPCFLCLRAAPGARRRPSSTSAGPDRVAVTVYRDPNRRRRRRRTSNG